MNWLNDFIQQIRWGVENFVWDIQDKIQMWKLDRELNKNCVRFVGDEYNDEELDQANGISGAWQDEEVEVKPKKKKAKKKSVKKAKKSV
jgi:3-deoxy-D-manno-octulosonate 8-phosphate phosphatase KdsC-like HAD superfamily phosphatase